MEEKVNLIISYHKNMVHTERINQVKITPVVSSTTDPSKIKGYDMFPLLYCNVFLAARKKSGKSSVIANILQKCIDKTTKVYFFCATHEKDDTYKAIKDNLEKRKIFSEFHTSLGNKGENLARLIEDLQKVQPEDESDSDDEPPQSVIKFNDDEIRINIKRKKPKKLAPKVVVIFDDIGDQLRNKYVSQLLKTNRHYKAKILVSSQHYFDIEPSARRQIDYFLVFKGINEEKLIELYKAADLNVSEKEFLDMYDYATKERYNFMYVSVTDCDYRKNFSERFRICEEKE
eukprot:Lithocolla_globosa_v1_NODE_286_length_4646_cov_126.764975.p2 type:complete len:288 gc:universal NODE_286_length_4646_cov_126.764975:1401-538(-)